MKEENKTDIQSQITEEQEIDLIELAQKIWAEKKLIFKWCGIAVVIGLVVAFSIPKEYSTDVTLAPENAGGSSGGGMGALAAMAGINIGSASGEEALNPQLYPDIVSSTPFLIELFDVKVKDIKGNEYPSLYNYLEEHQKGTWWGAIFSFPFKALGWFMDLFRSEGDEKGDGTVNPFMLTKKEAAISKALSDRITVEVDKKTGIISLSVIMQDPLISATLTDTVMNKLQNYITNYRTNKARQDLIFTEKLYEEARENYYALQQKFAKYVDSNKNVVQASFLIERDRLSNEVNLAFSIFNQVAQQLQMAKAKVQEITPVYTIVEPPSVPLRPVKPRKAMILIGFVFLAGVACVGWILFLRDFKNNFKKKTA